MELDECIGDTPPQVQRLYQEMLMRKSPAERMQMAFDMAAFVKQIVLSSIGDRDDWREQLFLRYYKDDFTPEQREQILARLRALRGPRPR
jgi:hypothetical protein